MTRKSHKKSLVLAINKTNSYNAALYVRLSVFDGNRDNGNSIENQEELLRDYIKNKEEFKLFSVYVDNGESGVNFDRPEFDRLIQDIKDKKVNCIIVKDLSRFGRNYIETGEYLEKIFPFLNIRFIAITDNYDSDSKNSLDNLSMHLLNLTNDIYAKDISKKIGTTLEEKQKNGEFIGSFAPYGYLKDKDNKNKLVVDKQVYFIVEKIFSLRLENNSYSQIVKWLIDNNISTPKMYYQNKEVYSNDCKWNDRTIKNILENSVYIGDMIQGKIKQSLFLGDKKKNIMPENWILIKDTHEAIINETVFYEVQKMNRNLAKKYKENLNKYDFLEKSENVFEGIIYCGKCNKLLKRYKNINKLKNSTKIKYFYICQNHSRDIGSCSFISISEEILKAIILQAIKGQILLSGNTDIFLQTINFNKNRSKELSDLAFKINDYSLEIKKLKEKKLQKYDDLLNENISRENYIEFDIECKNIELVLKGKIEKLRYEFLKVSKKKIIKKLEQVKMQDLSKEIIIVLISKVIVFERDMLEIEFN